VTENETAANPAFPLAIGALFALGAAYLGWQAGLGVYSAIYEYLRNSGGELALESKRTLATFRTCGWFAGAALGAFVFWRWHRSGALDPSVQRLSVKRVIVLALAGAGATHLGYLFINGASVEAMVLTAFASWICGSAFAAAYFGMQPRRYFAGRSVVAAFASFMVLWMSLAFDKALLLPYDALGRERFVWVKIAFPDSQTRHNYKDIKVELRTPSQSVKCFATFWETEGDRAILPMRCDFTELTPEREVVLTLPGEAPLVMKMPFARNPKPMYDYSTWISLRDGIAFRYRVT
jgi:hypothetical protein